MIECPYVVREWDTHVTCARYREATGFICTVTTDICKMHLESGGPESPLDDKIIKGLLRARLIGGDCPRYQGANPVDLDDAFARLATRVAREDLGAFLVEAIERWNAIPVSEGGLRPEEIEERAERISATYHLEPYLTAWVQKWAK